MLREATKKFFFYDPPPLELSGHRNFFLGLKSKKEFFTPPLFGPLVEEPFFAASLTWLLLTLNDRLLVAHFRRKIRGIW